MTIATRVFYRRIHFLHATHIPATGPVILLANHPGSLMDAALLGLLLNRPVHFFARGDIFKNKVIAALLRTLHMHPVHHHLDGRSSIHANDESFDTAIGLLQAGEIVLFFPEGFSHVDYYLLPFKKGAFRLAFQAMEKTGLPSLPIVPIGFHYTHPKALFSSVWVLASAPIETASWYSGYMHSPAKTVREICTTAFQAISAITIQVEKNRAKLLFNLLELFRTDPGYQGLLPGQQWQAEKELSRFIQDCQEDQLSVYQEYFTLRDAHLLKEEWITAAELPGSTRQLAWICWPIALPGLLVHGIAIYTAKRLADAKVTRVDFYAWILVAAAALLDIGLHLVLFILIAALFSLTPAVLFLAASMLAGWISWKSAPYLLVARNRSKCKKIPADSLQLLRAKRAKLMETIKVFLA